MGGLGRETREMRVSAPAGREGVGAAAPAARSGAAASHTCPSQRGTDLAGPGPAIPALPRAAAWPGASGGIAAGHARRRMPP